MKVNMKVTLGNITQNPVEEIFKAYRLCYSKLGQNEIKIPKLENGESDIQKMCDFIKPLMATNHTSPLEHVSFTFYIENVSRSLTHQLVRHRTGKYNQQSQRYVNLENIFDYIIPNEIEKDEECNEIFEDTMQEIYKRYVLLSEKLKSKYINQGMNNRSAEKKAIENARSILPNACSTKITMTIDANNFRRFLALRKCQHAQDEIRELANQMLDLVKPYIPFIDYKTMWCGTLCNECSK